MVVFAIVWTAILFVGFLVMDSMLANAIPIGDQYGTYIYNGQVLVNGRGGRFLEKRDNARITILAIITSALWLAPLLIYLSWKSSREKNSRAATMKISCPSCGAVNMFPEIKDNNHEAFTCGKCRKSFGGEL